VLGYDAAGVVEAVGPQVTGFKPGDEVWYAGSRVRPGTNAELHLVDERIVGSKPRSLSFAQAAAMPLTTITAWEALFDRLLDFQPGTPGEEILHAEALRQINHFLECRRLRLHSIRAGLPRAMWIVMFVGAFFNILLCWMFDTRFLTQLVLGGILAAYLGLMMYLIVDMNQPFRGEVSGSPEAFELLYQRMLED
jgi:hypothetical protein